MDFADEEVVAVLDLIFRHKYEVVDPLVSFFC